MFCVCGRLCDCGVLICEAESDAEFEFEEPIAECFQQLSIECLSVLKANFAFGGMNIDIDESRRQIEEEEADGVSSDHEESAVGFFKCMLQAAVLDPASVEEEELIASSGAAERWFTDMSVEPNFATAGQFGFG